VLLMPKRITYQQIMSIVEKFHGRLERRQPRAQKRDWP